MNKGYIKIHRAIKDSIFWEEKYTNLQAWLDLIISVQWKEREVFKYGKIYKLQKGQIEASTRFLSKRWNWSISKTTTFLKILEEKGDIKRRLLDRKFAILEVSNYLKYQDTENTDISDNKEEKDINDDTLTGTLTDTLNGTKIKHYNIKENINNEVLKVLTKKVLFDYGKKYKVFSTDFVQPLVDWYYNNPKEWEKPNKSITKRFITFIKRSDEYKKKNAGEQNEKYWKIITDLAQATEYDKEDRKTKRQVYHKLPDKIKSAVTELNIFNTYHSATLDKLRIMKLTLFKKIREA